MRSYTNNVSRGERWYYRAASLAVILTLVALLYLLGALLWPLTIPTIRLQPLPVLTPAIWPGQSLVYRLSYCKFYDFPEIVSHELVMTAPTARQRRLSVLSMSLSSLPVGCHDVEIDQPTPATLAPGRYVLVATRGYLARSLRSIYYQAETEPFEVR